MVDWLDAQLYPPTPRRESCEHEAAHAIVATHLGLRVLDIEVGADDEAGGGETSWVRGNPEDSAAALVAGELWINEFRLHVYPSGADGCRSDRRALAYNTDPFGERRAAVKARAILRDHADEVRQLADWLEATELSDHPDREQLVQSEIRRIVGHRIKESVL